MSGLGGNVWSAPTIGEFTRDELLGIAVARGCRHYEPLLPSGQPPADVPDLPHETLGAALMRGPADAATFQAIRCGAMVLSDLGNSPQRIAEAADFFGVVHRVAHLARLGLEFDRHPEFWQAVLDALPPAAGEEDFLPGLTRFTSDTGMRGLGRGPSRTWLRSRYAR